MSIQTFVEEKRTAAKKVKSAIVERWNTRVVPRGLHQMGKTGASAYLDSYGKGISSVKVTELAICAEAMSAPEMAAGFWEAAYNLETGEVAVLNEAGNPTTTAAVSAPAARPQAPKLEGLPPDLQPGLVHTMQPVDAPQEQLNYVLNPNFVGQPKRDGHRNILFATETQVAHQSRSTSSLVPIHPLFEAAVQSAAKECGPFVLDGERYYFSATGSEHRSAAQAATANILAGKGEVQPIPIYAVFKALFYQGKDLRNATEEERIKAAEYPTAIIASYLKRGGPAIEIVTSAFTTEEKYALIDCQKREGREGEVWTDLNCTYTGGKGHQNSFRTKYLQEDVFTIVGVTPSTAKGRSLASFEVEDSTGKAVGSVGTGFDEATGKKIIEEHEKNPRSLKASIRFQNFTESGTLWHARFLDLV